MPENKTAILDPELVNLLQLDRNTCNVIIETHPVVLVPNETYQTIACAVTNQRTPTGCRINYLKYRNSINLHGCPLRNQPKLLEQMQKFGFKIT